MKINNICLLFSLFCCTLLYSQGSTIESFVPQNWKKIAIAKGDLNNDGTEDAALVIQNTNPKNIIPNNFGPGPKTLNLNPRHLLILFNNKNGYSLKAANRIFIPTVNDTAETCMGDSFSIHDFSIQKGMLFVKFEDVNICAIFAMHETVFKFELYNDKFLLTGYDETGVHSASGEISRTSIDFLAGTKSEETGGNAFVKSDDHPGVTTKNVSIKKMLTLDALGCSNSISFDF
jgi:hypothetical protein